MKLLGSTKIKITKDKNGKNALNLEITEAVLVNCNITNNNYQQKSRVWYAFVPNNSFDQLLDISQKNVYFKKNFRISDSEFSYIKVWFTDQNSNPLEIEYKINITLIIN